MDISNNYLWVYKYENDGSQLYKSQSMRVKRALIGFWKRSVTLLIFYSWNYLMNLIISSRDFSETWCTMFGLYFKHNNPQLWHCFIETILHELQMWLLFELLNSRIKSSAISKGFREASVLKVFEWFSTSPLKIDLDLSRINDSTVLSI